MNPFRRALISILVEKYRTLISKGELKGDCGNLKKRTLQYSTF
jgi:hypothetical protein